MTLIDYQEYIKNREAYSYSSPSCNFTILQTGNLKNSDNFEGVFARGLEKEYQNGINLRRFELICQEIFKDCLDALRNNSIDDLHLENLKQITSAIVFWKMASQGGRKYIKVRNVLEKWNKNTTDKLLMAYEKKDMSQFRIGGIRIPTATAFMRFLFPNDYGIMDSRVVSNYTQPNEITTLSIRKDGYINDTNANVEKYNTEYIPFLRREALELNEKGITFQDVDSKGNIINSKFRPCDIEMALF